MDNLTTHTTVIADFDARRALRALGYRADDVEKTSLRITTIDDADDKRALDVARKMAESAPNSTCVVWFNTTQVVSKHMVKASVVSLPADKSVKSNDAEKMRPYDDDVVACTMATWDSTIYGNDPSEPGNILHVITAEFDVTVRGQGLVFARVGDSLVG